MKIPGRTVAKARVYPGQRTQSWVGTPSYPQLRMIRL